MTPYQGIDPIFAPPVIPGEGEWPDPETADDGDDRDAATAMTAAEGAIDRTNWLARRIVNGLEGGGPYVGHQYFASDVVIMAGAVGALVVPAGKTITITGLPTIRNSVLIECTVTGTIGADPGPSFRYSIDAGETYTAPASMGAATTLAITGTGVTVNFTAQLWSAGQEIGFALVPSGRLITEAPTFNDADGGKATFYGKVECHEDVLMTDSLTVQGPTDLEQSVDVGGLATFTGGTAHSASMTHVGVNAYRALRKVTGPDSTTTIEPWEQDLLVAPTLSADRTWTLAAPPGNAIVEVTVLRAVASGGFNLVLVNVGDPFAVATFGSGGLRSARLIYDGTIYHRVSSLNL